MTTPVPNLVTTVIPVYNRASLLRDAINSVLAQTYRDVETIIVDDGSTDDTPAVAGALASQNPGRVRVVSQPNAGPGAAREAGRRLARGEFIQYLDSDDLLQERKFEVQVAALRRHPQAILAYGATREYWLGQTPSESAARETAVAFSHILPRFLLRRAWHSVTPLYRRAVSDSAGPWSSLRQEEDWEYDCRVGALNRPLCHTSVFVADHRHHEDPRLCHAWLTDQAAMRDRVRAHVGVLKSARKAGIDDSVPEMKVFVRRLFALARKCGRLGLGEESRTLVKLAEQGAVERVLEFRIYRLLAAVIGWRGAAVFFESLPRHPGFLHARRHAGG